MSSKILGKEADLFARLAVDAVKSVKMENSMGGKKKKYPLSAIHIIKAHGQSSLDSELVAHGFALHATRASQGMPTVVDGGNVKIAMLDMNLQRHPMAMGVDITVTNPEEVEKIKRREMDIIKERINLILNAGAKVVLTSKGIDEIAMKYFLQAGVICARRVANDNLKRLAKATGGKVVTTLADMEGDESFDLENLGTVKSFEEIPDTLIVHKI